MLKDNIKSPTRCRDLPLEVKLKSQGKGAQAQYARWENGGRTER